jgi:hypothetical protein
MAGLYKTNHDRLSDILTANTLTGFRFRLAGSGDKLVPHITDEYEHHLAEESKADAITRLTIDNAMKG